MVTRFRLARLVRLRVLMAACVSVCLVAIGLEAVPAVPASAATVTASGPIISGISGKCLDDHNGSSADGAIVAISDCDGSSAQTWNIMSDGTIQINGKCLDISGGAASAQPGTKIILFTCPGGTPGGGFTWSQSGSALVNPATGLCLDDPNFSTTNGTQQQVWTCNGGPNQQWSLPQGGPVTLTYPGGDLVVSLDDGGLDPASVVRAFSTDLPESLGIPAGSSLSDVLAALYKKMSGAESGLVQPPTFGGGSVSVSGSTVTVTIPGADVPVGSSGLPGWLAGIIGSVVGYIVSLAVNGLCVFVLTAAGFTFTGPTAAAWAIPLCNAIAWFFWSFVSLLVTNKLSNQGETLNVWTILAYALTNSVVGATYPGASAWIVEKVPGWVTSAAGFVKSALNTLKNWFGGRAQEVQDGVVAGVDGAANEAPIELPEVVAQAGLASEVASGPVTSGFGGKCLDDYGGHQNKGDIADIYDCNGAPAQQWTYWSNGMVEMNALCLDIAGNSTVEGTNVQLWPCNGVGGQQWEQDGNSLVNPQSGMCLDDPGGNSTNGTQLRIWHCISPLPPSQQWILPGHSTTSGGSTPPLRVLPFGDSITWGTGSSDGSGYRCPLQSYMSAAGYSYQFVGSLTSSGSCSQLDNEGHYGWTIGQLQSIEHCTITAYKPNVVTLQIGTNDLNNGGDVGAAVGAIENLVNSIVADDSGVTVEIGGLIPTPNSTVADKMNSFNSQVAAWVNANSGTGNGAHLVWADMSSVTTADLGDGLHPDEAGYNKMAFNWLTGLDRAASSGWIGTAPTTSSPGCGNGSSGGVGISWTSRGIVAPGVSPPGNQIQFADINGDGKADYINVESGGTAQAWTNDGPGCGNWCWTPHWTFATGVGAPGSQIRFADINGDGKADYIVLNPDSSAQLWINNGPGCGSWCWSPQGTFATGVGVPGSQVQFADVNGDGRADYINVNPDSSAQLWINDGPGCGSWCWSPEGTFAPGVGAPGSQIRFADVNGDGKADYIDLNPDGTAQVWITSGPGCQPAPSWCWPSPQTFATGVGAPGSQIRFADVNGDHRADYINVNPDNSAQVWINTGSTGCSGPSSEAIWCWPSPQTLASGVIVPGSQIRFADINGDGRADYIDVNPDSSAEVWINGGAGCANWYSWCWASPVTFATGVGVPGSQILFADVNGDGRADYINVNPDSSAQLWIDNGPGCGNWCWSPQGTFAPGVGAPGSQIRFADVNGDGKADYIDLKPDGSAQVWITSGPGCQPAPSWCWPSPQTLATGVGAPGSEVRFADVNGDGKADYLVVNPDSSVQAWINGGPGCGSWCWSPQGTIATGVGDSGNNIQFAPFTLSGRADYLDLNPANGAVTAWING